MLPPLEGIEFPEGRHHMLDVDREKAWVGGGAVRITDRPGPEAAM